MKFIIDNRVNDPKSPIITIDTTPCTDLYSLRKVIEIALKLEGYNDEAIDTIFGRERVVSSKSETFTSNDTEYNDILVNKYK
jgi:hypothetical protein